MSDVERVARAICAAYGDDYDAQPESGAGLHPHDPGLPSRSDWRDMARAAIAAMGTSMPSMTCALGPDD